MKKNSLYIILVVSLLFLSSCEDWLTVRPRTEIEKDKLYQTEDGFWTAINGVYIKMGRIYSPLGNFTSGAVDQMAGIWNTTYESTEWRLARHQFKERSVNSKLTSMFLSQYEIVAHANTILEYIDKSDFLTQRSYDLIKGEALAIRAFAHFEILRLWGPMPNNVDANKRYLPYVKQISKNVNQHHTYSEFTNFIQADLDSASIYLAKSDPLIFHSVEQMNVNGGIKEYKDIYWYWRQNRMNYYAVTGLKARLALWLNDKENALKYAKEVIEAKNENGSAKFRLGIYNDITNDENNTFRSEHLYSGYNRTFNFPQYFPSSFAMDVNKYNRLYPTVANLATDVRSLLWRSSKTDPYSKLPTEVTCFKFYRKDVNTSIWTPAIRLAEMYLIAIESAKLDEANKLYTTFCTSRRANNVTLNSQNRQNTIETEYYKEFILEGQIFPMSKRLGLKNMRWIDNDMYKYQYELPVPDKEINFAN